MAIYTQRNALSIKPGSVPVTVHLSQGDVGNTIGFYLYNGSELVYLDGCQVSVHGIRPDGVGFGPYQVETASESNYVSFPVSADMTAVSGAALAEITITRTGATVGTANFAMLVEQGTFPDGAVYDTDISVYQQILNYVQSIPAGVREDYVKRIAEEAAARIAHDDLLQAQIDEMIAPTGEAPSAAEVQNARIGADGVTYPTLGDAIRANDTGLKNQIKNYNSVNNLDGWLTKRTGTSNGVTYTWADDICTITGTATSYSANVLAARKALPDGIMPGGRFDIRYKTTNPRAVLRIIFHGASADLKTVYINSDATVEVPEGTELCSMALYATPGATFTEPALVTEIAIVSAPANAELSETADVNFEALESLVNNGELSLTYDDFEPGSWSFSLKNLNSTRIRLKRMLPVKQGMIISIYNPTQKVYIGILPSRTAGSYSQVTGWMVPPVGSNLVVTNDGYMVAVVEGDTAPSVLDGYITIKTAESQDVEQIKDYNNYNVLSGYINRTKYTANGLTFVWEEDECIVSGTSTAVTVSVLKGLVPLPDEIKAGGNYLVKYSSTNERVVLRILFFDTNDDVIDTRYFPRGRTVHVPDEAVKWAIGIYVPPEVDLTTPAAVSDIAVLTQTELYDVVYRGRDSIDYIPHVLTWYNIPAELETFDAKTLEDNSYVRDTYARLAPTFEGTDPPSEFVRLMGQSAFMVIEKHVLNNFGNLYTLDVTTIAPVAHYRLQNFLDPVTGTYLMRWMTIERQNIYIADLDANTYVDLTHLMTDYMGFRYRGLKETNPGYRSMVMPVKKGDRMYLRTKVEEGAIIWAKIKQNSDAYELSDGTEFDGYIDFEYEGLFVFNVSMQNPIFTCWLDTAKSKQTVWRESQFLNALPNPQTQSNFPDYDPYNVCRVLQRGSTYMGGIHHWGIIGASFDSGEFNFTKTGISGQAELDWYEYSCWKYLQRINTIPDMYCYSDGGQNAKEWISLPRLSIRGYAYDTPDVEEVNPVWSGRSGIGPGGGCWWKMYQDYQNGDVKQAFVLNLGGNDVNHMHPHDENGDELDEYDPALYYKCGTIEDIGTYDLATNTDTPPEGKTGGVVPGIVNSYCGYIGAIMNRLIAIQPKCVIFICTVHNMFPHNTKLHALCAEYSAAIRQIAQMPQYKDHTFVLDAFEYGPNFMTLPMIDMMTGYHPDAMGYVYLAWTWQTMIDYAISGNLRKFRQSMFIGTEKELIE